MLMWLSHNRPCHQHFRLTSLLEGAIVQPDNILSTSERPTVTVYNFYNEVKRTDSTISRKESMKETGLPGMTPFPRGEYTLLILLNEAEHNLINTS